MSFKVWTPECDFCTKIKGFMDKER